MSHGGGGTRLWDERAEDSSLLFYTVSSARSRKGGNTEETGRGYILRGPHSGVPNTPRGHSREVENIHMQLCT